MSIEKEGGCNCGRVRYHAKVDPAEAYLCHCRMCQKATGGVSIAFVNLPKKDMQWTGSKPDYYASSPIARRPFCAACGTPLGFEFNEGDNMDLTVGSFDEPSDFMPKHHFGAESMNEKWLDTTALPRHRTDEHKPLVDRWIAATGKVPD